MDFFEPNRYFSRITAIDIQRDIVERGYTHILLDVDNTILTRDKHDIPHDVSLWLQEARKAGLEFCLVSNNWHKGVFEWANRLDMPIIAKAVKPLPPAFMLAMKKVGARRKSTLVIGDQLMTDVLGAHLLGMRAYMVCPLVEYDLKHTLFLRYIERVLMGDLSPEGAGVCAGHDDAGVENAVKRDTGFEGSVESSTCRNAPTDESSQATENG